MNDEGDDGRSGQKALKLETARQLYQFRRSPQDYRRSEVYFKAMMLVTVLQQDLKVHYNAPRAAEPDFRNSRRD